MNEATTRVFALVTIYHPDESLLESLASYQDTVERSLIWLNSHLPDSIKKDLETRFSGKIQVFGDGTNVGIGSALNTLVSVARKQGATHVLCMDQDSVFRPGAAQTLWETARSTSEIELFAPLHRVSEAKNQSAINPEPEWTMTSGTLISIKTFDHVGPFNEAFFIDGVDMDWCARLKQRSGKINLVTNAVLQHQLGNARYHNLLGIKWILVTDHSPFRYYYIFRNYFVLLLQKNVGSGSFKRAVLRILVQLLMSMLFYEPQTRVKLGYAAKGVSDFIRGKGGELLENVHKSKIRY